MTTCAVVPRVRRARPGILSFFPCPFSCPFLDGAVVGLGRLTLPSLPAV